MLLLIGDENVRYRMPFEIEIHQKDMANDGIVINPINQRVSPEEGTQIPNYTYPEVPIILGPNFLFDEAKAAVAKRPPSLVVSSRKVGGHQKVFVSYHQ